MILARHDGNECSAMERRKDISSYVKSKRIQSGLAPEDLAYACDLSLAEYRDIEGYDDELYMVVPLNTVACLCEHLKITLEKLYDSSPHATLLPKDYIKQKLNEKSLSVLELSDFVGIEESYIEAILEDIINIGDWVMDPVILLTNKLELNLGSVLNSYSRYRK